MPTLPVRSWRSCDRGRLRLLPAGDPGEPLEVGLPGTARGGLALEQCPCLAQDEGVGTARSAGLVANGEFMAVEPAVDVPSPLLVDRPFEQSRLRVGEEGAEGVAELAAAIRRRDDGPVEALGDE